MLVVFSQELEGQNFGQVMDIAPDEADMLLKKRGTFEWDHRKRKFIHTAAGQTEKDRKKSRTESGARDTLGTKKGIYEKWQKQMKGRVQGEGEEESEMSGSVFGQRRVNSRMGFEVPNKGVKSQLKSKEQMLKEKKKQSRDKARKAKHSNVSKKGGGGGVRGGGASAGRRRGK